MIEIGFTPSYEDCIKSGFYADIYQFANIELPWLAKYTTYRSRGYSAPKNDSYLKFCHESSLANATEQESR